MLAPAKISCTECGSHVRSPGLCDVCSQLPRVRKQPVLTLNVQVTADDLERLDSPIAVATERVLREMGLPKLWVLWDEDGDLVRLVVQDPTANGTFVVGLADRDDCSPEMFGRDESTEPFAFTVRLHIAVEVIQADREEREKQHDFEVECGRYLGRYYSKHE